MFSGASIAYIIISLLTAAVDVLCAMESFRRRSRVGAWLGTACVGSAVVNISYLIGALVNDYFAFSFFTAIYFGSITVVMLCMVGYAINFTGLQNSKFYRTVFASFMVITFLDYIVEMINPFKEIAISYIPRAGALEVYEYQMKGLYWAHLVFVYVMVLFLAWLFICKMRRVPLEYRAQYLYPMLCLLVIILINLVYLFVPAFSFFEMLDYSIWFYSVGAVFFFWTTFKYAKGGMLNHFYRPIIENITQGIVLFNYDNELIFANEKIRKLMPEIDFDSDITLDQFSGYLGISVELGNLRRNRSLQCFVKNQEGTVQPLRCDYKPILSTRRKHEIMGRMFSMTDVTLETDLLTGFHNWESFLHLIRNEEPSSALGRVVVVMDINSLSEINASLGHAAGDQAISSLANHMRMIFPSGTYFIRGKDAYLMAVCYYMTEKEVRECARKVQESISWGMQYGIAVITENCPTLLDAVELASNSMKTKKLLDIKSKHSEMLSSLIRALKESDHDTEAHVKRTQAMGAMLGQRIGLTDTQMSHLSLLCILHDIGKIGIPLEILNKPGQLTNAEWKTLQTHVEKGYQIARSNSEMAPIADMIRYHHERWDGKGYPEGLSRESIPLLSRIIAVVDSYDAMVNDRVYRKALSPETAQEELRKCAGNQFDPMIVSEFIQMIRENAPEETMLSEEETQNYPQARQSVDPVEPIQEEGTPKTVHPITYAKYLLDDDMRIVSVDKTFEELTGYSMRDIRENNMHQIDLLPKEDSLEYACVVQEALASGDSAYLEHRIRCKDGSVIMVFCFGRQYFDSAERAGRSEIYIADSSRMYAVRTMLQDAHTRAENRLEKWENKYRCDSLTGLLNHEALQSDVELKLLSKSCQAMMLMMDVDKFKEYNDTYGHHAGDEFLILIAQTLSQALRGEDLACRMGGDEFAAVLFFGRHVPHQSMLNRAQQVYDKITMTLNAAKGGTSLSMGVAISEENGLNTFNKLYEASDKALYRSKEEGRGRMSVHNG